MHLVAERDATADAVGDAVVALVRAYRHALRHPVASALPDLELALLLGEQLATRLVQALADELDHRTTLADRHISTTSDSTPLKLSLIHI